MAWLGLAWLGLELFVILKLRAFPRWESSSLIAITVMKARAFRDQADSDRSLSLVIVE